MFLLCLQCFSPFSLYVRCSWIADALLEGDIFQCLLLRKPFTWLLVLHAVVFQQLLFCPPVQSYPSLGVLVLWLGQWVMWMDHLVIAQCPPLPATYLGICPSYVPALLCGLSFGPWLKWSWILRIWSYLRLRCLSYLPSSLSYQ
jgi:hypothetical protein